MRLGIVADDFTGAADVANAVASSGLSTQLVIGSDTVIETTGEAAVVALKSRSVSPDEAVALSVAGLTRLREAGCERIFFKYCSTFDSTPEGNIGPVADALAAALNARTVVFCPAFPQTGRTVYQGHLFVGDRLLSESSLARHPLNPMTDPDLVRWLGLQTKTPVGLTPHAIVQAGPDALAAALAEPGPRFRVIDAITDRDLDTLGRALADAPLSTGASGLAAGLARALAVRRPSADPGAFKAARGPAVLLSGSCSNATLEQVRRYEEHGPVFRIDMRRLMEDGDTGGAEAFLRETLDRSPLISSSEESATVADLQAAFGTEVVAQRTEAAFRTLARTAVAAGAKRIISAGGETSGAVIEALGLRRLDLGPEIAPGVPALSSRSPELALALKSGNFGGPDFFVRALAALEARA